MPFCSVAKKTAAASQSKVSVNSPSLTARSNLVISWLNIFGAALSEILADRFDFAGRRIGASTTMQPGG